MLNERIYENTVVNGLYFVFECRLFEATRVSISDVRTCLKTVKWLFERNSLRLFAEIFARKCR